MIGYLVGLGALATLVYGQASGLLVGWALLGTWAVGVPLALQTAPDARTRRRIGQGAAALVIAFTLATLPLWLAGWSPVVLGLAAAACEAPRWWFGVLERT